MRIVYCFICCLLFGIQLSAQDIIKKLRTASQIFEKDSQMRHAIYSLYVIDGKTGTVVFDKNAEIGLAPASCQKLITSGAAFELLGREFRYRTDLALGGKTKNQYDQNNTAEILVITSDGDPTFGSWRFETTKADSILKRWASRIRNLGINPFNEIKIYTPGWTYEPTPDGWIWQDIGNYYGAGAEGINWRENQYDMVLKSGNRVGGKVEIVRTKPELMNFQLFSSVIAAERGTGDNAYIYLSKTEPIGRVRGTIPVGENNFTISGSIPSPAFQLLSELDMELLNDSIRAANISVNYLTSEIEKTVVIDSVLSPSLDSINYWFLRRSINLYGEALIKTVAHKKTGIASTEKGVEIVKDFWSHQGIDKAAINIIDGSGLSPQNRVTTNALVKVLQYAKKRQWYNSFYLSLPTYNGMKMKSGSIGGARSFAGYHSSKDGKDYIFAIIVNNYDGSASAMVRKMYQVLDALK